LVKEVRGEFRLCQSLRQGYGSQKGFGGRGMSCELTGSRQSLVSSRQKKWYWVLPARLSASVVRVGVLACRRGRVLGERSKE